MLESHPLLPVLATSGLDHVWYVDDADDDDDDDDDDDVYVYVDQRVRTSSIAASTCYQRSGS